jgi:PAS domain S-box-containing protein
MNILIVDDRPANLKLLRAVLEAEGTTVSEAVDGVEALDLLQREPVDAIISDILMPRMDGYRLCMEVRANRRFRDLPFIAYTATYTSDRDEKLMTDMGADCFLRKPASASLLTSTLEDLVHSKRSRPPLPSRMRSQVDLLNEYNGCLVAKLEERNVDREATIEPWARVANERDGWTAITERQTAEKASREQDRQWRKFIATSTAAVFVVQDDCITHANTQAARITAAASAGDLIGRNLFDFVPKDQRVCGSSLPCLTGPQDNPAPFFEQELQRADGTVVEIETSVLHFQFRGEPALLVEARDISERKRAKSRLALQHAVTAALAEDAPISAINQKVLAVLTAGLHGDFSELWMIERGSHVLRCIETWHAPSIEFQQFVAETRPLTFASGHGHPGQVWSSGQVEWCADLLQNMVCPPCHQAIPLGLRSWIGFPIKLHQEVLGVIGFFSRKVTAADPDAEMISFFETIGLQMGQFIERQQLAEQLRQAQKMEAIGSLAGGIAHDFNNILGAIYGHCELARMEAGDSAALTEHLDAVMGAARRATDLVGQILAFSRQQDQERRPIQLRDITAEALRLLRAAVPATIEFQTSLDADTPVVLANATQLHQILMNLGTNAAHAMRKDGGRLTVRLEHFEVGPELAAALPELHVGCYARLTVRDTGHGMDAKTLGRIYEPLFTTKPLGEGTGFGLAVVRGIVNAHQGAITVSSRRGEGTTFQVYFPAHLTDVEETAKADSDVPHGSGERILFVDDEESLANVGKLVLDHIGYATDTCSNAREAIARVSANPFAYSLVITDQMMLGMTGTDLAQRLNVIRPDLPIILTTGFTDTLVPDRLRAIGVRQLLAKPLSVQALAAAVREALPATASLT